MSSISAGRLNFGFLLFSLAVIASLSADTNNTTAGKISDPPSETQTVAEELSVKDNSIDGDFNVSTRAYHNAVPTTTYAKAEIDNHSTTETIRDYETSNGASARSASITTLKTTRQYNRTALESTTNQVDDQTTTDDNTATDVSLGTNADTTPEPIRNNGVQQEESTSLQFIGNSLDDVTYNIAENQTTPADTKPTEETIMGVAIKTVVSVSLKLKDTKVIGPNAITNEESYDSNSTFSYSSNDTDLEKPIRFHNSYSESTESVNETASNGTSLDNNTELSLSKSAIQNDLPNDTVVKSNASDADNRGAAFTTEQPNSTEACFNCSAEVHSNQTQSKTEIVSNSTDADTSENQVNMTETNLVTEVTEESANTTGNSTAERRITDVPSSANTTIETITERSTSRFTVEDNETSTATTHLKTHSPTNVSWSPPSTEIGNATNAEIITTTLQPTVRYEGEMKIVSGLSWSEVLLERHSSLYKHAARRVRLLLEDVFAGMLKEVEIDGFSEGSVVVDYYVIFVESDVLDRDYLVHAFNSYFRNNNTFDGFTIDPKATQFHIAKVEDVQPTAEPRVKPLLPQWVVAVVVIAAASLVFIILFAAVTIYGRHYGRRSYNKKLQGDEIIFDRPDYQSGPRLSDAAYENLAADAVYDVESSPEKSDVMIGSGDYQFDSWRTNRLTRMPSSKRFSFNSS